MSDTAPAAPPVTETPSADATAGEHEIDALLADFQAACEECVQCSNSDTTMNRAILRNALRAKLLAATARITALEAALDAARSCFKHIVTNRLNDQGKPCEFGSSCDCSECTARQGIDRITAARTARSAT